MSDAIVNKVANSDLVSLDLEKYYPLGDIISFDLKEHLFMGLILKEKDFREKLKQTDWSQYQDKYVAVHCSADAIIPVWAYMLVAANLQPVAGELFTGTPDEMRKHLFLKNIANINPDDFANARVVIKGCGDLPIGEFAYAEITRHLLPVAKSIMYGEPCSTVPVYKKRG